MPQLNKNSRRVSGSAGLATALLVGAVAHASPECNERALDVECEGTARWAAFPLVGYEPETSWLFGGFVQRYFDSPRPSDAIADFPRRSVVSLFAAATLKGQVVAALELVNCSFWNRLTVRRRPKSVANEPFNG